MRPKADAEGPENSFTMSRVGVFLRCEKTAVTHKDRGFPGWESSASSFDITLRLRTCIIISQASQSNSHS